MSTFAYAPSMPHLRLARPGPPSFAARPAWRALRPVALASCLTLLGTVTPAAVNVSGAFWSDPVGLVLGPGDTLLPGAALWVGSGAVGSLGLDGASFLQLAHLSLGSGRTGEGTALLSGAGSRLELVGNGSGRQTQRLVVGDNGSGSLSVLAGAVLDTSQQYAPCLIQFRYCDSFVGAAAGDSASLTITGAGSLVRVASHLFVGHPGFAPPTATDAGYGRVGGTVNAAVQVLDGGQLVTDRAQIGTSQWDSGNTGQERSVSNVLVSGAGSRWVSLGGQSWDLVSGATVNPGSGIGTANDRLAVANIELAQGGQMRIEGVPDVYNYLNLSTGGGRTDMSISGKDSALVFAGDNSVLQVGRRLGSARLSVSQGGMVQGVWYVSVGRDGSFGELMVDGADSRILLDGLASAAATGSAQNPVLDIGRGGTGVVGISGGARLEIIASQARSNGPQMNLGREAASSGTLNITGAGSLVRLTASSVVASGGAREAFNPFVRIGRNGTGVLNISDGAQLLLEGQALSTAVDTRRTSVFIGGSGDNSVGGKGFATVIGAGSALQVKGADAYIGIGHGPQAVGQLNVSQGGALAATVLAVGNYGGSGVLKLDNAQVDLAGQFTGSGEFGATLAVGTGSGATGNLSASNGTLIRISNAAGNGGGVTIGGSRTLSGGDGVMTLSASSLLLDVPTGNGGMTVGRSGSGLLRLQNGSRVDLGSNSLLVGRDSGSDGTLIATGGSSIQAGWVGIGRWRDAATGDSFDGGTATMVLNGATLNAQTIVIGTNGYLGGSAGSISAGLIENHGIFSPGSSPGTFTVDADFVAAAGNRMILEVQSDGSGGFLTDRVLFTSGHLLDMSALRVEFRFLGDTNPNAFQASGLFGIDTFLRGVAPGDATVALSHALFATTSFAASADRYSISGFSFSADGGATFSAAAVPEPSAAVMLLAGMLTLLGWRRLGSARALRA